MAVNEACNGFATERDHEDVVKFMANFERYGLIGMGVQALAPQGIEGSSVSISSDPEKGATVGIPLGMVEMARQPMSRDNKLGMMILHETAHRMLETRARVAPSADDLLGMAGTALSKPSRREPIGPSISSDGARDWPTEEQIAARLIAKREERSSAPLPGSGTGAQAPKG